MSMPENYVMPKPVLKPGILYLAYDRYVCTECCGQNALYTGKTIHGCKLVKVPHKGTCECGRVKQ